MRRLLFPFALMLAITVAIAGYFSSGYSLHADPTPSLLSSQQLADQIIVEKAARKLTLLRQGDVMYSYDIRLGFDPVGQKVKEGDGKTPEGHYKIDRRNDRSAFHLSLGLNYPTAAQKDAAREKGIDPGGDIFIHGQPNGLGDSPDLIGGLPYDWTEGCIALSNKDMREIWQHVALGTAIEIKP